MTKPVYGGQAVPEGIMFQSKTHMSTAIRRTNGDIDYFDMPRPNKKFLNKLKKYRLYAAMWQLSNPASTV